MIPLLMIRKINRSIFFYLLVFQIDEIDLSLKKVENLN
jgi:hypothetical protein